MTDERWTCDGLTCRCHWPSICPDCGCLHNEWMSNDIETRQTTDPEANEPARSPLKEGSSVTRRVTLADFPAQWLRWSMTRLPWSEAG